MKKYLYFLLANLLAGVAYGQNYNMSNSSANTCSGNFYDSGGSGGNYGNSQTFVFTICPSTPGSRIRVNFTAFNLENNYDFLEIFDGNSTAAPSLGAYTGTTGPGLTQATISNPTGCLTFRFTSDGSVTSTGWAAVISCTVPCQTITANLASTNPAAQGDGIIRICQGGSVTFNGSGTFSSSSAGATYRWAMGDGTFINGQSVTKTYPSAGSYMVNVTITDPNGCTNSNAINQYVQVSTTPTITTSSVPDPICLGQSSALGATVTPTQFVPNCTPPVSGTTFLPDGTGVSYTTSIPVSCFANGQTITNGNQITNVCLNMEHSFLGDLSIELICPNGQTMVIKAYPGGGGTYLGNALDDGSTNPGTGATYCFTPTATTLLVNGSTVTSGNPAGPSIAAGNYMPVQPFSNMVGCPANGNWTIRVTDNLGIDNGYIFSWDINFANTLVPANGVFTPTIVSQGWQPNATLTSTGTTTATVTPTATGNNCYTYSVTDNHGCTYTQNECVMVNANTPASISPAAVTICAGQSTTLTASGGGTYAWSTGANTAAITVSPAATTTYTVTVTNANGCTTTASRTVNVGAGVTASGVGTNILCFGASTGAINITPSGGTLPYSFNWGGGITTEDRTGLAAGTYTITVSDAVGCNTTVTTTLTQPAAALSGSTDVTNVSCNGGTNGAINLTPAGGTAGYSFNWGGGINTEDRTGLAIGTYTVTITDANSCTATASGTVTQPTALTASNTVTNVLCFGASTGAIDLTVSGGTTAYSFNWGAGVTTEDRTGLAAGTYTVTVTDANGCTTTSSATITQPATAVSASNTVTNVLCFGASTGAINLTATGGIPGYTYNWGGGINTEDRTNVPAGTYTVTVTDANGCTTTSSATITQPATAVSASNTVTNVLCFGASTGAIDLTASNGTPGYTYNWGGGINTEDRTNVPAGTYTVTVTDANGCTTTSSATVAQPATAVSASNTVTNVLCFGGTTGAINLTPAGGTPGYTFNWAGGITTEDRTGLAAGTYSVTVTDANGCTTTSSATITQPATPVYATSTAINVSCFGGNNGSINLIPSGGTAPYGFNWGAGVTTEDRTGLVAGTYTVTVTDANGCTTTETVTIQQPPAAFTASNTVTNVLCFGASTGAVDVTIDTILSPCSSPVIALNEVMYRSTVSDGVEPNAGEMIELIGPPGANIGCYVLSDGDWTITIPPGTTIPADGFFTIGNNNVYGAGTFDLDAENCGCFTDVLASGPLMVLTNSGEYISMFSNTGAFIDGLVYGTPTAANTPPNGAAVLAGNVVTTAGLAGCPTSVTIPSTGYLTHPGGVAIGTSLIRNPNGSGAWGSLAGGNMGSCNTTVSTPTYTFAWSNSATTVDLTAVPAGNYTLTITDNNGCTATTSATVTQPASAVSGTTTTTAALCNIPGAVNLTPAGGTPGYTFLWNNGATTEDLASAPAGNYTVTITDANGCTATATATVTQNSPAVTATTSVSNTLCVGSADGTINLTPAGGTPGYTFDWGGGITTEDRTGLAAGTYTVTITDAAGCFLVTSATVGQPTAVSGTATTTPVSCLAGSNGAINLTPAGGTPGYTFAWSNSSTNEDPTGLAAGIYTVTITDANGCTATTSATVTEPATAVSASNTVTDVLCFGASTGAINVTPAGGTPGYTYNWGGGITTEDRTGLPAGTYVVTVTDNNGCTTTTSATIAQPATAVSVASPVINPACGGLPQGAVNLTVSGGTPGYTFIWSNGATTEDITGLLGGIYTATITDANGCTLTTSGTITEPPALTIANTSTNVSCNGGSNGSINVTTGGGTPGYSFAWSNSATTEDITGLATGAYTLTVTDANGCTISTAANISQPALLTATVVGTNISCNAGTNGAVNLTVGGGTPGYNFNWSNSAITEDLTSVGVGTYTVTVTDANSCTATATATLTQPTAFVTSATTTDAVCNASATGAIDLTVSGATPGYTFAWSNGATTEDLNNILANTYTVTITDASGCTTTLSRTINQPAAITTSSTTTAVLCNGGSTGSINLTVGGGAPAYTYLWSNASTTEDLSNLAAGTYTVTVTDANSCTTTASATVTQPTAITVTTASTAVSCFGGANGTATATVSGGTAGYTFAWSANAGSQTTATATGLTAGTKSVTITDANGCTATATVTVNQPATAVSATTTATAVLCNGSATGTATVTPAGGTSGYSFLWSANGQTTATATGLTAGNHTVTVTDANGCTVAATANVPNVPAITASTTTTAVSCFGGNNGTATVAANGGVGGFSYQWANGQTTTTATGLAAGQHCVTVTDANGCTLAVCATVSQPTALTTPTVIATNILCFGQTNGTLTASTSGGVQPYSYHWSNGQNGATATNLAAGTYFVTATDANGCSVIGSGSIVQPTAVSITMSSDSVNCFGQSTGSATVVATGGTPGYTYLWNTGGNSATIANVPAGVYVVTVTDASGCARVGTINVGQPATPVMINILNSNNVTCNGGNDGLIHADAFGGTPSYTFVWSNGQTTATATGLTAGTYGVTATDAAGCTISTSRTLTQPTALSLQTQVISNYNGADISCPGAADGMARVLVAGGTPGYTYAWSGLSQNSATVSGLLAGTYGVTVTDAAGCTATGSVTLENPVQLAATFQQVNVFCFGQATGQIVATATPGTGTLGVNGYEYSILGPGANQPFGSNNLFTGLIAGTYTVTVRDGNGCFIVQSIQITQPTALASTVSSSPAACAGTATGSLTANPTGGTAPYTFHWNNNQNTQTATGLAAGNYSVTVTDANGCLFVTNGTVTQPLPLSATVNPQNVSCNGGSNGSANVSVSGGTAPYSSVWSNGQNGFNATSLTAGNYSVTVTDAHGCTAVRTFTITQPSAVSISVSTTNALCNGVANGTATATVAGGTAPYSILWNNGQTGTTATGLAAGNYSVVVTDANGCLANASFTIAQPTGMALTFPLVNQPSCNGGSNGSASVSVAGGSQPYSFAWSNGQNNATATGLSAGNHTVTVTDANGCIATGTVTIGQPNALAINLLSQEHVSCKGGNDGQLSVSATGGTAPFGFVWSNGQNGATATNLAAGLYTVTATDANGCSTTMTLQITEPASALVGSIQVSNALCNGASTGEIAAIVSGGTAPYSYLWNNGATTAQQLNVTAGTYTVTVTDANGCQLVLNGIINQPVPINLLIVSSVNPTCFGGNDGSATATAAGGTGGISFQWSDAAGQTTAIATGLAAGTYTVVATDANGCSVSASVEITDPAQITAQAVVTNVACYGQTNGSIAVSGVNYTVSVYAWSNGVVGANANPLTGLGAGSYELTITTDLGCTNSFQYEVGEPDSMAVTTVQMASVLCFGGNEGQLAASVTGGNTPYSYAWSNGDATQVADSLTAGTYTVVATDALGCTATATASLSEPQPLFVTADATGIRCTGDENGTITVAATGGTLVVNPYQYSIDTNQVNWQTGNLFNGLGAGIYTVYAQDDNGCVDSVQVSVEDADPFFITNFDVLDTTYIEYFDTIQLVAGLNDTLGATWAWLAGADTVNTNALSIFQAPGETVIYTFTAINGNGCVVDTTVTITVDKPRRVGVPTGFTPNGDGNNDVLFVQGDDKVAAVQLFRVYDRWGELVFEVSEAAINDPAAGWDGTFKAKMMNSGVFAWYAEVRFLDGHVELFRGDVTLLR